MLNKTTVSLRGRTLRAVFNFENLRKLFKSRMMRTALANRIIRSLKSYRKVFELILLTSYLILLVLMTSYLKWDGFSFVAPTSYLPVLASLAVKRRNPFGRDFWVEELGGNGPSVAAYLRVSTEKQVRGMSLEVQKDRIDKMKLELKPSRVYWFVDAGLSGEDFDRRKLRKILAFREKGEVDELWVTHIDRIGRECRKSLLFFLQFTEDNGIIRTPERIFTTRDLADILIFTIESFGAEIENKRRAQRANDSKIKNFESGKWNKPIPLGYMASNNWIAKMSEYEPIVQDIFNTFIHCGGNVGRTARAINSKYGKVLSRPLTRNRLKRILSDPVYIGRPMFMKAMVVDESLKYIDDGTFNKCQELLKKDGKNQQPIEKSAFARFVNTYDVSLLDFLEQNVEFHHRGCGGTLARNGTRYEGLILQQAFKCSLCDTEFRVPTKTTLSELFSRLQLSQKITETKHQEKVIPQEEHKKMEQMQKEADQRTMDDYY